MHRRTSVFWAPPCPWNFSLHANKVLYELRNMNQHVHIPNASTLCFYIVLTWRSSSKFLGNNIAPTHQWVELIVYAVLRKPHCCPSTERVKQVFAQTSLHSSFCCAVPLGSYKIDEKSNLRLQILFLISYGLDLICLFFACCHLFRAICSLVEWLNLWQSVGATGECETLIILVKPQQWSTPSESIAIYCVRKLVSCVTHLQSCANLCSLNSVVAVFSGGVAIVLKFCNLQFL